MPPCIVLLAQSLLADGWAHEAKITQKTKVQKDGDTKTEVKAEESVDSDK